MTATTASVLMINLAASLFMSGVIWMIQIVHYPLFAAVGADSFMRYAAQHNNLISVVVVLPMLVELVSAVALVAVPLPGIHSRWLAFLALALVVVAWGSTFLLQVPAHGELLGGFDADAHRRLVGSNWVRTLAWSARSGLLLGWVWRGLLA